jgi:uncharacterized OB-fold protein
MTAIFHTGLPATGTLTLQQCGQCARVNYPARELCGHCLADALSWQAVADGGSVLATTAIHYSLEPGYAGHLPWAVASIKLECGPVVLAHLSPGIASHDRVRLKIIQDRGGNRMLLAVGTGPSAQQAALAWLADVEFREVCA